MVHGPCMMYFLDGIVNTIKVPIIHFSMEQRDGNSPLGPDTQAFQYADVCEVGILAIVEFSYSAVVPIILNVSGSRITKWENVSC